MNTPSLTSHVVVVDITPDTGRMVIVTLSGGESEHNRSTPF